MDFLTGLPKHVRSCLWGHSLQTRKRCFDGLIAVLLLFLAQLLICGFHHVTDKINNFPAPIIAMLAVATVMIIMNSFVENVEVFYHLYLRGPTDLLNRHMSVGFTVPFMMILRGPTASLRDVGLIIAGFVVTGILNSGLVYFASLGVQTVATCSRQHHNGHMDTGAEKTIGTIAVDFFGPSPRLPNACQNRSRKCLSTVSTITNNRSVGDGSGEADSQIQREPLSRGTERWQRRLVSFLGLNPVLALSFLATVLVGLPLSLKTGNSGPLDTFLLAFLWMGTLAAQSAAKSTERLAPFPRWQAFAATALNPVLWTSLAMIAYVCATAAARQTGIDTVLDAFTTGTTLDDVIHGPPQAAAAAPRGMGAGDVAVSILNAGIVAWGLKLFECRAQLLSRAGLTALVVGSAAALLNVACGPLLARAMGLAPPARALAFAARSVTLALAGPAMASLGGDVGLNAAMVVFSGIVFQMGMGLGVGASAEALVRRWKTRGASGRRRDGADAEKGRRGVVVRGSNDDGRAQHGTETDAVAELADGGACDDPRTVAAGIAVGINAAAMGTAHLYESGSRAAPYAALSMTIFGVMTVVFTSVQPLVRWLAGQVL